MSRTEVILICQSRGLEGAGMLLVEFARAMLLRSVPLLTPSVMSQVSCLWEALILPDGGIIRSNRKGSVRWCSMCRFVTRCSIGR